jgi:deoxyribonuclease-4
MRIGRHMPTHSKPLKAVEIAQHIGCNTIQIFVGNPTGWRPAAENQAASDAFAAAARLHNLDPVVVHAAYLINLASPEETIWEKSIALLTWTMRRAALLGGQYVVVHTGSHRGSGVEAGIARIVQALKRILPETPSAVMLLLENDVGGGNALGHSFEHLAAILAQVAQQYQERVGICLDTAHLWGAGHDISTPASTLAVLCHFDETVGLSHLKILHLNDTMVSIGSHRDVHARLGEGLLGEEGLRTLLNDPRLQHIAVLLETPIVTDEHGKEDWEHDARHMAMAKELLVELGP